MAEANPTAAVLFSGNISGMCDNMIARDDLEVLLDFEIEENTVKGFVTDYFKYRLSLSGHSWPDCPNITYKNICAYKIMRSVVKLFEEKHATEMGEMIKNLCVNKQLSFQRYVGVVENFGVSGGEKELQMSYGRLIALLAFGGILVAHLADSNIRRDITPVALYTSKFIEKRILTTWAKDGRSWGEFFKLGEQILRNNREMADIESESSKIWPLIGIFSITLFGAILIGRFLLPMRLK